MKKVLLIFVILSVALSIANASAVFAARPETVTVCHFGVTTQVNMKSLPGHLGHGDTLGPCIEDPPNGEPTPELESQQPTAQPLFNMVLLIKNDPPAGWLPYCILKSEGPPSVDIQALPWMCGWVADNSICAGPMYDDGSWVCDSYGYDRQPLSELRK